jgi:predicted metalloprotease with PDZ domain
MTKPRCRSRERRNPPQTTRISTALAHLLHAARRKGCGAAVAGVAFAYLGCTAFTHRPASLSAGVATGEHITAAPQRLDLDVLVRPRTGLDPHFDVVVTARSDDLPRRFVVQKSWAGEPSVLARIADVTATCSGQPAELTREDLDTHVGWTLPARCNEAKLTYRVGASPEGLDWGTEYEAVVTPAFASMIAETALVLPDVPDETRARVSVYFDLQEMPGAEGIYSLGAGQIDTTTRAARHAYFAVGKFITTRTVVGGLTLEARFAANVQFDTAAATRDLGRLLASEAALFPDDPGETLRMLVVGMPEANGAAHGTSLTSSAALWVDGAKPWNVEAARLSAHEMFHLYNGQVVRRAAPDEKTYWLSEGFTEHYTDELMLRAHTWTAHDWFEAVRYRVRAYHTNKEVETPNDRAELGWGGAAAQLPYLRGSLVAAYVDHVMRSKSGGERSLDDFMRELVARARSGKPPLDQQEILHLLAREIDADSMRVVREVAIDGKRIVLPPDAFGSCVVVVGSGIETDLEVRSGVDLEKCVKAGR